MANSTNTSDYVANLRLRAVTDGNMRTANTDCPEKNGGVVTMLQALRNSTEWRVKAAALERLAQVCGAAPAQVQKLIPLWIPAAVTQQVWDTKAQVSKTARAALTALSRTNTNTDIKDTIPPTSMTMGFTLVGNYCTDAGFLSFSNFFVLHLSYSINTVVHSSPRVIV